MTEAAAAYRRILALRPDVAEVANSLGNVLLMQGRLDEAAAQYHRALAQMPELYQAHNNLGNILRRQGKLDQAAARYQQVLALRPDLAEPYNNLGNVLQAQGKLDEAAARFSQALTLRPDLAEPHNNLGNVLREQGKLDEAEARYRQAVALKPDYAEAINNLGNLRWEQGRFDDADACYRQALACRPDYAEVHYHRSDLKTFRRGDPDLALLESLAHADVAGPEPWGSSGVSVPPAPESFVLATFQVGLVEGRRSCTESDTASQYAFSQLMMTVLKGLHRTEIHLQPRWIEHPQQEALEARLPLTDPQRVPRLPSTAFSAPRQPVPLKGGVVVPSLHAFCVLLGVALASSVPG